MGSGDELFEIERSPHCLDTQRSNWNGPADGFRCAVAIGCAHPTGPRIPFSPNRIELATRVCDPSRCRRLAWLLVSSFVRNSEATETVVNSQRFRPGRNSVSSRNFEDTADSTGDFIVSLRLLARAAGVVGIHRGSSIESDEGGSADPLLEELRDHFRNPVLGSSSLATKDMSIAASSVDSLGDSPSAWAIRFAATEKPPGPPALASIRLRMKSNRRTMGSSTGPVSVFSMSRTADSALKGMVLSQVPKGSRYLALLNRVQGRRVLTLVQVEMTVTAKRTLPNMQLMF